MAINVFLAVLEYYLFAALVGIFLPFGLLSPTKFLAEKAVGAVVSASVKLMVLAFVTAIIDPVLSHIHFAGPEITFNELWSVFLTVCALMFFCWKAPSLAARSARRLAAPWRRRPLASGFDTHRGGDGARRDRRPRRLPEFRPRKRRKLSGLREA